MDKLTALIESADKAAEDKRSKQSLRPGEDPIPVVTSKGAEVGQVSIGSYHPRNGSATPVIVEEVGGVSHYIGLLSFRAMALELAPELGLQPIPAEAAKAAEPKKS